MTQDSTSAYPEHAKLEAVRERSQVIGEFLDGTPFVLAEYREVDGHREPQLMPVNKSIEQVLAEHFDIDLNRIEAEKRAMLENMRTMGS